MKGEEISSLKKHMKSLEEENLKRKIEAEELEIENKKLKVSIEDNSHKFTKKE